MKKTSKKGFTLVEIVVVLVILAIMAGFAVPAYNGFVTKAKQSEVLAEARLIYVATQASVQEKLATAGLSASLSTTASSSAEALKTSIESYTSSLGTYTVTVSVAGVISAVAYSDGTYTATWSSSGWTVTTATIASTLVTIIA